MSYRYALCEEALVLSYYGTPCILGENVDQGSSVCKYIRVCNTFRGRRINQSFSATESCWTNTAEQGAYPRMYGRDPLATEEIETDVECKYLTAVRKETVVPYSCRKQAFLGTLFYLFNKWNI